MYLMFITLRGQELLSLRLKQEAALPIHAVYDPLQDSKVIYWVYQRGDFGQWCCD
jgi:hypothetical protein